MSAMISLRWKEILILLYTMLQQAPARSFTAAAGANGTPIQISLMLEDCGGVARHHLASERTFLAYVRTSLTIASAGVGMAQLLTLSVRLKKEILVSLKPFEVYARPLVVSSILLAFTAFSRSLDCASASSIDDITVV
ncbi:hypothetical protein DFH09DRAFT_1301922 [Mycena vulgaris]|nr:hypothetical protein DFH09DRAFT_1301922 [Mycena vulgaris]